MTARREMPLTSMRGGEDVSLVTGGDISNPGSR